MDREYCSSFVILIILSSLLVVLVVPVAPQAALECKGKENLYTITVSKGGSAGKGVFATVQEAVDSIPSNNEQWTKILVKPGIYKEQVTIPSDKECIVVEGENRLTTIITSSVQESNHHIDDATVVDSYQNDATVVVQASNFVARAITFQNSLGKNGKGLAMAVYGDRCSFQSMGFTGYQDTIYDAIGRHFFNSCYIEGAVDFIWGAGQSFYQSCVINSTGPGFITAQGRVKSTDTNGFVFSDCQVTGKGPTYLGRAYRPYATVVYQGSQFDNIITPLGWDPMLYPKDVDQFTFAEVSCRGPGADQSQRVHWEKQLDNQDLQKYTRKNFVDQENWIANQPN